MFQHQFSKATIDPLDSLTFPQHSFVPVLGGVDELCFPPHFVGTRLPEEWDSVEAARKIIESEGKQEGVPLPQGLLDEYLASHRLHLPFLGGSVSSISGGSEALLRKKLFGTDLGEMTSRMHAALLEMIEKHRADAHLIRIQGVVDIPLTEASAVESHLLSVQGFRDYPLRLEGTLRLSDHQQRVFLAANGEGRRGLQLIAQRPFVPPQFVRDLSPEKDGSLPGYGEIFYKRVNAAELSVASKLQAALLLSQANPHIGYQQVSHLSSPTSTLFLAFRRPEREQPDAQTIILGAIVLECDPSGFAEITDWVAVPRPWRPKGVGRKLLDLAMEHHRTYHMLYHLYGEFNTAGADRVAEEAGFVRGPHLMEGHVPVNGRIADFSLMQHQPPKA